MQRDMTLAARVVLRMMPRTAEQIYDVVSREQEKKLLRMFGEPNDFVDSITNVQLHPFLDAQTTPQSLSRATLPSEEV